MQTFRIRGHIPRFEMLTGNIHARTPIVHGGAVGARKLRIFRIRHAESRNRCINRGGVQYGQSTRESHACTGKHRIMHDPGTAFVMMACSVATRRRRLFYGWTCWQGL